MENIINIFKRVIGWPGNKPSFHYAYICQSGFCHAVVRLDYPLQRPDAIPIDRLDASILGKRWQDKRWINQRNPHGPCTNIPSGSWLGHSSKYLTEGKIDGKTVTQQGQI